MKQRALTTSNPRLNTFPLYQSFIRNDGHANQLLWITFCIIIKYQIVIFNKKKY